MIRRFFYHTVTGICAVYTVMLCCAPASHVPTATEVVAVPGSGTSMYDFEEQFDRNATSFKEKLVPRVRTRGSPPFSTVQYSTVVQL